LEAPPPPPTSERAKGWVGLDTLSELATSTSRGGFRFGHRVRQPRAGDGHGPVLSLGACGLRSEAPGLARTRKGPARFPAVPVLGRCRTGRAGRSADDRQTVRLISTLDDPRTLTWTRNYPSRAVNPAPTRSSRVGVPMRFRVGPGTFFACAPGWCNSNTCVRVLGPDPPGSGPDPTGPGSFFSAARAPALVAGRYYIACVRGLSPDWILPGPDRIRIPGSEWVVRRCCSCYRPCRSVVQDLRTRCRPRFDPPGYLSPGADRVRSSAAGPATRSCRAGTRSRPRGSPGSEFS
jgi:hypothetical protein